MSISLSNFTSNRANGIGGALCMSSGNVVVNDNSFVGNSAVIGEPIKRVVQWSYRVEPLLPITPSLSTTWGAMEGTYIGSVFVHHCKFLKNRATG